VVDGIRPGIWPAIVQAPTGPLIAHAIITLERGVWLQSDGGERYRVGRSIVGRPEGAAREGGQATSFHAPKEFAVLDRDDAVRAAASWLNGSSWAQCVLTCAIARLPLELALAVETDSDVRGESQHSSASLNGNLVLTRSRWSGDPTWILLPAKHPMNETGAAARAINEIAAHLNRPAADLAAELAGYRADEVSALYRRFAADVRAVVQRGDTPHSVSPAGQAPGHEP